MRRIKDAILFLIGNLLVGAIYAILVALDLAVTGWYLWGPMVAGPAAAPGARDGPGLIFVFLFWLCVTGMLTAMLVAVQTAILKRIFPWWEPPETD